MKNSEGYYNKNYCNVLDYKLNEEFESGNNCCILNNVLEKTNLIKTVKKKVQSESFISKKDCINYAGI